MIGIKERLILVNRIKQKANRNDIYNLIAKEQKKNSTFNSLMKRKDKDAINHTLKPSFSKSTLTNSSSGLNIISNKPKDLTISNFDKKEVSKTQDFELKFDQSKTNIIDIKKTFNNLGINIYDIIDKSNTIKNSNESIIQFKTSNRINSDIKSKLPLIKSLDISKKEKFGYKHELIPAKVGLNQIQRYNSIVKIDNKLTSSSSFYRKDSLDKICHTSKYNHMHLTYKNEEKYKTKVKINK